MTSRPLHPVRRRAAGAIVAALLAGLLAAAGGSGPAGALPPGPSFTVDKTTPTSTVTVGDTVTWNIVVKNTGGVDLTGIDVDDDIADGCDAQGQTLPVGAFLLLTCTTVTDQVGTLTNGVSVTAAETAGAVTDSEVVDVQSAPPPPPPGPASFTVVKSSPTSSVVVGDTVTWNVVIKNTGAVGLTAVEADDDIANGCDTQGQTLAVGQFLLLTCTSPAAALGPLTNSVTVRSAETTGTVTATATVTVANTPPPPAEPPLLVTKTASTPSAAPGETVTWTVAVKNTELTTATNVDVDDDIADDCDAAGLSIPPGQSVELTCTSTPTEVGSLVNTVSVTSDQTTSPLTASATVDVATTGPTCLPPAFSDVGDQHPFFADICWMDQSDIANGFADGTYRPGSPVTRQAMAAFLYRLAGEPAVPPSAPLFPDVAASSPFATAIRWMASAGIAEGYSDGGYHPSAAVSRQAMAAFMHALAGSPAFTPTGPHFSDVGTGSDFYLEIEWMRSTGVADGYPEGDFRPLRAVSRQAMAAFVHRFATDVGVGV